MSALAVVSVDQLKASSKAPGKKVVWFDARDLGNKRKTLALVNNLRFEFLVLRHEQFEKIKIPRQMKAIVEVKEGTELGELPKDTVLLSDKPDFLAGAKNQGYRTALYHRISNQKEMDLAHVLGEQFDFLIAEFVSETNIPLELLIAKLQKKHTVLLKAVSNSQDAEIAFGVMEVGSDGVLLQTEDVKEIQAVDKLIGRQECGKLELVEASVVDVQHLGMGYRSCVDTTAIMQKNEGMVVGSTATGGLILSSETHFLPYMDLRPFRVNAGAVHSYIWAPNDMTAYLTELKVGSKVLCVDTEGNTRPLTVGRVKTELRPLIKIEAEAAGRMINAIVQDDWHIRIFSHDGKPRNASNIRVGEKLLAYLSCGARHVGIQIDELLEER